MFERLAADPVDESRMILDCGIATYQPTKVYALFSGGHDSLCAAHIAAQHPGFAGCVHICTGIGIPETSQYVRETCAQYGWPLQEFTPPKSYDELVMAYGFPGPSMHYVMYSALKERCLRALVRKEGLSRKCRQCHRLTHARKTFGTDLRINHPYNPACILLVSGVRLEESKRRMAYGKHYHQEGPRVFCAPILGWSNAERHAYMADQGLSHNPVADKLCMSGECLCGAFASENEIQELERWYPEVAQRIHDLEAKVARTTDKPCQWGKEPKEPYIPDPNQNDLFSLCWSCGNKPLTYSEAEETSA